MRIIVLGSAAGGGFPQWNCNCVNCRRARSGDPFARRRTQCSLAVSANGLDWILLNASPDLRVQIASQPRLHPSGTRRDSPIRAAILCSGEVDAVAGLLHLRERQPLSIYAPEQVIRLLDANPIFHVLDPVAVERHELAFGRDNDVKARGDHDLSLSVAAFPVPGKVALYAENEDAADFASIAGDVVGLSVRDRANGTMFYFVPGCAALPSDLLARFTGATLLFFDGTLWEDDEMIRLGLGIKTGSRMGHLSVSGSGGSLAALRATNVTRKVFIHVNNSNPMILDDSPERASVEEAGWEVAYDGMVIEL